MKKWLLVLGMITCILSVSACGSEQKAESTRADITEENAFMNAEMVLSSVMTYAGEEYADLRGQIEAEDPVLAAGISSWESAQADIGDYVGILDRNAEISEDEIIVRLKLDGSNHDAEFEMIIEGAYSSAQISNIAVNVEYSFGELMQKAALNTLLGMGTVFVILILISLIISCFNFIPKIQAAFAKPQPKEEKKEEPVDHTIAQIVEKEELSDDLELVAVIAAAVAASEGAVSTDGFVVRSIRKRKY